MDFEDLFGETPKPADEPEDVRVGEYVPEPAPPLEVRPRYVPPPVAPVALARPSSAMVAQDAIRDAEDRLARKSTDILDAALDWPVVAELTDPPKEWVETLGAEKARERFVVAKSALMSKARAPIGLEIAAKAALGIFRNRAGERDMERPLNLSVVQIQMVDPPSFPEVVETEGE